MTKLTSSAILKAAGFDTVSNPDEFLKSQLEGAVLTLKGVNIDPEALGMSEVNTLVMAQGIRTARESESLAKKKEESIRFKTGTLIPSYKKLVKNNLDNINKLIQIVIGLSPTKSISDSIKLSDGRILGVTLTGIQSLSKEEKEEIDKLKTFEKLVISDLKRELEAIGIKQIVSLLDLESGTKDNKTISLFSKDDMPKKEKMTYQVSLKIVKPEKKTETTKTETTKTKLIKK